MKEAPEELKKWLKEAWPHERDVVSRPDRLKYLKRAKKPDVCVFCDIREVGVSVESLMLYRTQHSMVVLNKYPYNSGHTLVLPMRHEGNLTQLSQEEYLDLTQVLRLTFEILEKEYKCAGLNVGMNHGNIAGAGIPEHLHWHLVPRWLGDTNFFPLIAEVKTVPETLVQSYERLKPHFPET